MSWFSLQKSSRFLTFSLGMIFVSSISCLFYTYTLQAAWPIPRDGLRLELMLATWTRDTSGNNRPVTLTGVNPSYGTDSSYNSVQYAQFNWGGITANSSWIGTSSADYTFSFWMKLPSSLLQNNSINKLTPLLYPMMTPYWGYDTSYYHTPMVIFSSKSNKTDPSLRFAITNDWKCYTLGFNSSTFIHWKVWWGVYWVWAHHDMYASYYWWFQCSKLIDWKWHHVVMTRKTKNLRILVDGEVIYQWTDTSPIGKNISLGYMWYWFDYDYYAPYPITTINEIISSHFYKGSMFAFREYSRALTDQEIENLSQEFSYLSGTITSDVKWKSYDSSRSALNIEIIDSRNPQSLYTYSYEVNNWTPNSFTSITPIVNGMNYTATAQLNQYPDGTINMTVKAMSGGAYVYTIWSLTFTKMDNPLAITINMPDSNIASEKYISANVSSWWILSYALTRWVICDGTLQFDNYTDLTFVNSDDNGTRVCYKAFYSNLNKTIYKLSLPIQWIKPTEVATNSINNNLFADYLLWRKSTYQKSNDSTSMVLELLGTPQNSKGFNGSYWLPSISYWNGITMTDINGDWLVDFLYALNEPIRRAIVINMWNYTFKTVYKCAIDWSAPSFTYYWDCADPTR